MGKLLRYLDVQLAVDARSLGLGRVGLALVVLFDLAQRTCNLTAHYSDDGVMPRWALADPALGQGWSLHALSGSATFEAVLFAVAALFALAWLVGYKTRIAQVAVFLLSTSLQARNPYLRDGQDDWLHVAIFWTLWLPLGQCFSLDAFLSRGKVQRSTRVSGLVVFGLAAQLLLIYWSAAIGKCQSPWWREGIGLQRALELDFYETYAGHWLRALPALTHVINFAVIITELALPLLLFVPWARDRCRLAAVIAFCGFHLGMGIFLKLGTFPWVCLSTWMLLLPPSVWRAQSANAKPLPRDAFLAALPFLCVCLLIVVNGHGWRQLFPDQVNWLAVNLGIDQNWVVFSPRGAISTGYMVAPAKDAQDHDLDLFSGDAPLTWERPVLVSSTFRDRRWRQFYRNLLGRPEPRTPLDVFQTEVRQATAQWICFDYEHRHGTKLRSVDLVYVAHLLGRPESEHRVPVAHEICR